MGTFLRYSYLNASLVAKPSKSLGNDILAFFEKQWPRQRFLKADKNLLVRNFKL